VQTGKEMTMNWVFFLLSLASFLVPGIAAATGPAGISVEIHASPSAKTIIELQPFRQTSSIKIGNARDTEEQATLINLNPGVNAWYLLRLDRGRGAGAENNHLENYTPPNQKILLEQGYTAGLIMNEGTKQSFCNLWETGSAGALKVAKTANAAYTPLCEGKIYLRNPVKGYRTEIETAAEFFRDELPGGEKIETFVRDTFFAKGYREQAKIAKEASPPPGGLLQVSLENDPVSALLDPRQADRVITSSHLGMDVERGSQDMSMAPGNWYPVKDSPGVYVSLITAGSVAPEIMRSYPTSVSRLDPEELDALVYLVAFDLDRFDVRFSRGTDHPRVNWSERMLNQMKDKSLPGPDGIGTVAPLVSTGMISPRDAGRTVAAFTGGFKRTHGAFMWGELARKNHGSHYGFMESGVIFSALQPALATLYSLTSGRTEMGTWTEANNRLLPEIVSARQNGVPLIAGFDEAAKIAVPGSLVSRWGDGNWSGSINSKLRTLRAGTALQEAGKNRFLIYAVFTSATPSAMVRVFQAYRCRYAMQLDMNALELTYMALYTRKGTELHVQHLIQGMAEADRSVKGKYLPRFLSYPDNRDFFYLLQKEKR
jgi:hypothetical protein